MAENNQANAPAQEQDLSEILKVRRKKLAALIFQNKEAVETMNAIIHPMAWEEIRYAINHSDKEIIVVEAALYDDDHNAMFDEIW